MSGPRHSRTLVLPLQTPSCSPRREERGPAEPSPRYPRVLPPPAGPAHLQFRPLPLAPLLHSPPTPPPRSERWRPGEDSGESGGGGSCASRGVPVTGGRRGAAPTATAGEPGSARGAAAAPLGDWREEEAQGARGQRDGLSPSRLK